MAMFDLGLHFEVCRSDMPHVSQGKNNMKLLSCRHVADIDAAYLVSHIQWLQFLSRQSAYRYLHSPDSEHAAIVHHVEGTLSLGGLLLPELDA